MKNIVLALFACAWLAACTESQRVVPTKTTDLGTLHAMYQEVEEMAQDRSCSETSACASLPLGSKPCGGPWRYLIYSKERVDETELQAKVAELGAYECEYNREYQVLSTCDLEPGVASECVNGECVALNPSP